MIKGEGGEAEIFALGDGTAIKLYKQPDHPQFEGDRAEQQKAKKRLDEHQVKLAALIELAPKLPDHLVKPVQLATTRPQGGRVVGYQAQFIDPAEVLFRYTQRRYRENGGITQEQMVRILLSMHPTVRAAHKAGLVFGDFNDLNVLVQGDNTFILDIDSAQFGRFLTRMFTARFVDPLLCDQTSTRSMLVKPHTEDSDWYAFAVMVMQCMLFVDPYGGVYKPKNKRNRVKHDQRPLKRITVFNPEVKYPKPAVPFGVLPDDLLQLFHRIFEKDTRGEFPLKLLQAVRWTTCTKCGTEHARATCPECKEAAPAAVKQRVEIRGNVTATRVFTTPGILLFADVQAGQLRYLYHEYDAFRREGNQVVLQGPLTPQMRYRIQGDRTLMAKRSKLVTFDPSAPRKTQTIDRYGRLPILDANATNAFWSEGGALMRDGGEFDQSVRIGDVMKDQTMLWAGDKFGFGFYRAGRYSAFFVFDAKSTGINDSVQLPPIKGQLLDATCVFTDHYAWFFISTQEKGHTVNRCYLIRKNGTVKASAEANAGDGSWLTSIRGKTAAGGFLLAATDEGLVRIEAEDEELAVTKEFPDTERYVDSTSPLLIGDGGVYVICRREIYHLKIS